MADDASALFNEDHLRWFELIRKAIETPVAINFQQLTMPTGRLLGRSTAGTGPVEALSVTAPLTLAAGALGITGSALTRVNDTNITATLTGTPATALLAAVEITLGWTGTLGLSRGGTAADLSATGGASQVLKQSSSGAAVTVGVLAGSDITGAALTKTDDTNVTLTLGGSPTTALLRAASLTLGWTGTLSVARGGSGTGTAFTTGSVVFAGASGVYAQDNTNFFWDDTNNRLGLGTNAPQWALHVVGPVAAIYRYGGGPPQWTTFKANGTQASPTAVTADGSSAGELGAYVYDGAAYQNTGFIRFTLDGVASAGSHAGRIEFYTTPTGSDVSLLRMSLGQQGNIGLGIAASSVARLAIVDTQSASSYKGLSIAIANTDTTLAQLYGAFATVTGSNSSGSTISTGAHFQATSSATGTAAGNWTIGIENVVRQSSTTTMDQMIANSTLITIDASRGTVANAYGFSLAANIGASSTLTSLRHLDLSNPTGAGTLTTQYGLYIADLTKGGTNYSIYAGTAQSYFAGKIGIGVTSPTALLHLKAGTATANTAPLKFTSGTSLTTAEAGAIEFTTDDFFATITTGAARKGIVLDDGARLTSGKIPIATTNGRLIDGQTPLAGTKVYYVSDTSGGAVTRKLTFTAGILTSET